MSEETTRSQTGNALESSAGAVVGRYTVESELARGGMGVIYRVRDGELSRILAMKVMTTAPGGSSEASSKIELARFLEEAQVTAQLDHPGIVPVHEAGSDPQGKPFFTMKLVKGHNLSEIFKLAREEKEGWNLPRAVGVMVKACQALAYAHDKGVIHRDLKPANIMVGRFGEVYVMDWGLAKITGRKDLHDIRPKDVQLTSASIRSPRYESSESTPESPLITMDGSVVGTPAYMSPEQARGEVEAVDQFSDIYSLGAILYNLLTGQPPYVEPGARISPHTILGMVIQGPPRRVHQLNPQAPPELIAICERAMARGKKDRYPTSLDLAEELQAFLDHRVVRAYRTGAVAEFRSWVARNKMAAFAAGASVLLVLMFVGAYAARERAITTREKTRAVELKDALARQYLRRGQAFCEEGNTALGLHWLARSLREAPAQRAELRETIQKNLASWGQQWRAPRAMLLHDSIVYAVAFSPDGKHLVTGDHSGSVQLWSVETGEALAISVKHDAAVELALFSPDGKRLLSTSRDPAICLWDATNGQPLAPPKKQQATVVAAAFRPDGKRIVTGTDDGTMGFWNGLNGELLGTLLPHKSRVNSVVFSPDGQWFLTASDDQTVRLWNGETGQPVGLPIQHNGSVIIAMFSPDGSRFVSVSDDGIGRLWTKDAQPLGMPIRHDEVRSVDFSPDGQRLLTGGADRSARLWNAFTGEALGPPIWHERSVFTVRFSADGRQMLTAGFDGTVRFWSAETRDAVGLPVRATSSGPVWQIVLSPDGRTLIGNGLSHAVGLWSINSGEHQRVASFPMPGTTVAFAPDASRLLVGDANGQVWWWSIQTGEARRSKMTHDRQIWSVAVSADAKRALTASADNTARLWSLDAEERLLWNFSHQGEVRAAAFSPDGRFVATASFDKTVRVWSTTSGQPIGAPLRHSNFVEDVSFSPDGATLATACGDGKARLWSVESGRPEGHAMSHHAPVLAVEFRPDGKQLVTGSRDQTARFWSVPGGQPTGLVLQHGGWVEDVCFSSDGRQLVTATAGMFGLRIWSADAGEMIGPALQPLGRAWEAAFSPDGTRIAASSTAWGVRHWAIPPILKMDLRDAELWVQVLTWQEMDEHGVLSLLDRHTWKARRAQLEKLGMKLP